MKTQSLQLALEAIKSALRAFQAGDKADALAHLDESLRMLPSDTDRRLAEQNPRLKASFFYWRALLGLSCERLASALADISIAIACAPENARIIALKAEIMKVYGQNNEAIEAYQRAVQLMPSQADWHYNLGLCFEYGRQWDQALACFDTVLQLEPTHLAALNHQAVLYQRMGELLRADANWSSALAISPAYMPARLNRALMWLESGLQSKAQAELEALLESQPTLVQAQIALGGLHLAAARPSRALRYLEDAFELAPDSPFLLGQLMICCLQLAEWERLPELESKLTHALSRGRAACTPFSLLALVDDPAWHLQAAQQYLEQTIGVNCLQRRRFTRGLAGGDRLRIGYFSSDLHEHATAYLMAQLFETHDRSSFEIYLFSYGKTTEDAMQRRLQRAADHWIDIAMATDKQVQERVEAYGIDIAVDLKGYTYMSRPKLFAQGLAPVQVSYLGYPGSLGSTVMDYVVVDHVLVANDSEAAAFTEQLVRLPVCYQVNDGCWQPDANTALECQGFARERLRRENGLDPDGVVYCCFNNTYKVTPQVFEDWMTILLAVPQSQLWLLKDNEWAPKQLQTQAWKKGVDPQRLVFANRLPRPQHLWRHGLADIFLDTFPYNAHTTASDALRCGLPLVTRMGSSFASRVAASLLTQIGMYACITTEREGYRQIATALGQDPYLLASFRRKLLLALETSSLFDASGLRPWLERAFRIMAQRAREGAGPAPIDFTTVP